MPAHLTSAISWGRQRPDSQEITRRNLQGEALSWPELCSLIAAAIAAGAFLVAVAVRTQRLAGWVPEGQQ
jgi:hypothetical protein